MGGQINETAADLIFLKAFLNQKNFRLNRLEVTHLDND